MSSMNTVGEYRGGAGERQVGQRHGVRFAVRTLGVGAIAMIVSTMPGCAAGKRVQVRHEQMTLPWYTALSVAQTTPGMYHPYPIAAKAGPETDAGQRIFETIVLENEYLTVHVAPEIQGAVVRAIHKPTGEDLFHRCSVEQAMAEKSKGVDTDS